MAPSASQMLPGGGSLPPPPVVLLAAGEGSRLVPGGVERLPKPLVTVAGRTLAEHGLSYFHSLGVERFVVAVGFQAARVTEHFETVAERLGVELDTVLVAGWQQGNGVSALAVRDVVDADRFVLAMTDHLFFSQELGRVVLAQPPAYGTVALAVDGDRRGIFDLDDLTKVRVRNRRVVAIGKRLEDWDAGDTGLFHCSPALFDALEEAIRCGCYGLSDGIRILAEAGDVVCIDVTGLGWLDVDTPETLAEAERLLAG